MFYPDISLVIVKESLVFVIVKISCVMVWFDFCFTALQHILDHFGHSQLPLPYCSWASLLGSFPVLSAHILPVTDICSSWISKRRTMAVESCLWPSLHEKNAPDMGIKLKEASMPSSHATAACLSCIMVLVITTFYQGILIVIVKESIVIVTMVLL